MCFTFLFFIHSNQINIINSLRDELTSKYNIDIHTSLLRIVMTYETRIIMIIHSFIIAKSEYQRYLLQICLILLAHMFIERETSSKKNSFRINQ